jgi:hypothetical protein
VPFRDWSSEQKEAFDEQAYQSVFNNVPSVPYLSDDENEAAREIFALGWLTWPMAPEEAEEYRQQFYDLTYMPENLFRALGLWEEYRELYSEVDAG